MFSGQGGQYVSMGKDLYEAFSEAREIFDAADDFLKSHFSNILFEGPQDLLTETVNSQLAVYVHGMALLRILNKELPDLHPLVVSGLSLGEYTALTASGKITFSDGLKIIKLRAGFMNEICHESKGSMVAVLGLPFQEVEEVISVLGTDVWIANYNAPLQTVISGEEKAVEHASEVIKNKGARKLIKLNVSGAFHSPLMQKAEGLLKNYLVDLPISDSSVSFVSNVVGDYVAESEEIRNLLFRQITSPTKWFQGCLKMSNQAEVFLEIGCGKVLTNLNKSIGIKQPSYNIDSLLGLENFLKVMNYC
ncbi:MAG: ACP S-malonyltransferase [Victivallaceae bacterium]